MAFDTLTLAHIGLGTATLCLYWATFAQVKGSRRHRRLGRLFLWSWVPVLASVGGVTVLKSTSFTPPELIQFVYLSVCVAVVSATAFLAIRWKRDLARFRGHWFKAAGAAIFALGALVLAAGLATGAVLRMTFSTVGLIYGGAMLRFAWMRTPVHANWPMIWHLNGMIFLFNAIHGTLAAVIWRAAIDPAAGEAVQVVSHFGTLAICLALRLYWGARYGAPLRMAAGRTAALAA